MDLSTIVNIVILAVLIVWSFWFKHNWTSYWKKKGENAATKEDIGDITDKIESVRGQYVQELEAIKSQLHVLSETETSINQKSVDALIQQFEIGVRLSKIELFQNVRMFANADERTQYQSRVLKLFDDLFMAYHRSALYKQDRDDLYEAAKKMLDSAIPVRLQFVSYYKVQHALDEEQQAIGSVTNDEFKKILDISNKAIDEFREKLDPVLKEFSQAVDGYLLILHRYLMEFRVENKDSSSKEGE